jgi:hypothetical protein
MSAYMRFLLLAIAVVLLAVSCGGCATTKAYVVFTAPLDGATVSGIVEVR